MKLWGITGGIGMGKSTTARCLAGLGIPVVDTDDIAHRLVAPGEAALQEIVRVFGPEMLTDAGHLHRGRLAAVVFSDIQRLRKLEAILHPRIRAAWQKEVTGWREAGAPSGAVVIPLLYETGAEESFGAIIAVGCTAATQRERLEARGWSSEQMNQRVSAQQPAAEKWQRADFVIWSEGNEKGHCEQVRRIVRETI